MAEDQASMLHLVPDIEEEENVVDNRAPLDKAKGDILYFLRLAGAEGKYNYRLERISGTEAEDEMESERNAEKFHTECMKIIVRKREAERLYASAKRARPALPPLPPLPPRYEVQRQGAPPPHKIEREPFDRNDESTWGNVPKVLLFEEVKELREDLAVAKQANATICAIEQTSQEELKRRRVQLVTINDRARRAIQIKKWSLAKFGRELAVKADGSGAPSTGLLVGRGKSYDS